VPPPRCPDQVRLSVAEAIGADPCERAPGRGSAKPIACYATAGSDLDAAPGSWTLEAPRKTAACSTGCAV
jgi:hypothetical protein